MRPHHIVIVLILTLSLAVGPAEAGLLSWLQDTFWSLVSSLPTWKANDLGTSGKFNNYGGHQDFSGQTITTGYTDSPSKIGTNSFNNFNNNGFTISGMSFNSNGLTYNSANDLFKTGDGVLEMTGSILVGDKRWNTMLRGSIYLLLRRQYFDNKKCVEEMFFIWRGGKKGKTFKPECIQNGFYRNIMYHKAVLVVGSPTENFCLFTSKENEYYYKENGEWKKCKIVGDKIQEDVIKQESEIAKITDRINKWVDLMNGYSSRVSMIADEQRKAGDKLGQDCRSIGASMQEAGLRHGMNMQEISRIWAFKDINTMELKHDEESARFDQEMMDLDKKMDLRNAQYEVENKEFDERYAAEDRKLEQDYNSLRQKGY